jgi:hypothetical protein
MSQLSQIEMNTPYKVQYDPLKTNNMSHTLFRYGFKPGSMSKKQEGTISFNEKDGIEANFESENYFTGTKTDTKSIFVLIYDKNRQTFRLERIKSQVQLKKSLVKQELKKSDKIVPFVVKKESVVMPKEEKVIQKDLPSTVVAPIPLVGKMSSQFDSDDSSDDSDTSDSD